jgi:hypothetical protein
LGFTTLPKRFLTSILLLLLLATLAVFEILYISFNEKLVLFGIIGLFLSVALTLFLENFQKLKCWRYLIELGALALVVLYCWALPSTPTSWHLPIIIQTIVLTTVPIAAIFLTSFFRKNLEVPYWNFGKTTLLNAVFYILCGSILYSGLTFSIAVIERLFNIIITDHLYVYLAIFVYILLIPLLILAKIPMKEEKFSNTLSLPKIIKIPTLYILLPLLALYFLRLNGHFLG